MLKDIIEKICDGSTDAGINIIVSNTAQIVAREVRKALKVTADDVYKVGDHYWGGDYEPSYVELCRLAESYNEIMDKKFDRLQSLENGLESKR